MLSIQGVVFLVVCCCCATPVLTQQHYVNIAQGKTCSQISRHVLQSSPGNAANGNTSGVYTADNCIHTNVSGNTPVPSNEPHWWQVDLGEVYPVYSITVWGRDNYAGRLYPLSITVDDQPCVTVTSVPGTRQHSVTCTNIVYGRVVRLTRTTNDILNLCELQIYVCDSGYYGTNCTSSCGGGCEGGCYRDTGNCINCRNGFWGPQKCQQSCSSHCSTVACQRANGHCTGCKSGYYGPKCDTPCSSRTSRCTQCTQGGSCTACSGHFVAPACTSCSGNFAGTTCTECQPGYYGVQCDATCSSQTARCTQCDRQNGTCTACTGHFTPPQCTECQPGYYGGQCDATCSSRTPRCTQCDRQNGTCTACTGHFKPSGCTECEDGYYKQTPSNCIQCPVTCDQDSPCDKTTGRCEGCPPGTQGDFCDQDCDGGQYGPSRCSLPCGQCQDGAQCHRVTGHCHSCHPGYYPPLCNETCTNNTYGQNCSESCGHCKGGQPCDPETGHCTTGCQPGYSGQLCETECEAGRYGEGCNQTCGQCQVNTTCHRETGHCLGGCAADYTGNLCAQRIESPDSTETSSAVIAGSVVGVLAAVIIAVVVVVFIMRRRKEKSKSGSVNGDDGVVYNNIPAADSTENGSITRLGGPKTTAKGDNDNDAPMKATVTSKGAKPAKTDGAIYENVPVPQRNSKPSAAQNGDQKPQKKEKPPVAAKPSKGKEPTAGTVTLSDPLMDDEEEDFKTSDANYANEEVYANIRPTGIRVDQLQETVVERLRDGTLDEEFMRLHPKKDFATKNGERKENYYKNRFNSILPYDKNRVVLSQVDGDDASDYVNASFVRGSRQARGYVAAQGPRDNTMDEFWRMVWQEGVTDIVMLTNIKEANKPKCYDYWPAQGDRLTTGHMEVTGVEEETRAHFVIRTFDLKQAQGSPSSVRRVKQYHYQSWMDHEVPATTPLVNFWRYVRSRAPRTAQAPPLLVHCSAGVGRTGTFIALDIVIDHAQQEAEIDIYKTVDRLRDDRCHMVQNKGQYRFLHEAVLEAYLSGGSRLQVSDMDTLLPHTLSPHTPQHTVDTQFETLCKMRSCQAPLTYTTANSAENKSKNRNSDALPSDQHLVYLTKHVKDRNQYINAVYMSTFLKQRGAIMTQLPLPDTLVDFWRLVDGCDVSTIVSIGDVEGGKNMCGYWPQKVGCPMKIGPYSISLQSVVKLGDTLSRYTLGMERDNTSRRVQVLHLTGWAGQVADSMADLCQLLTILHTSQEDRGGKPVILQCLDGASRSGVVCALWDVISRMTCDAQLDVYIAVTQLHTVRPDAITSLEQYRYCYAVAQHFKNSQNVYANT